MSKNERNWKLFVMDILESINKIEKYIEGLNYEQFVRDEKTSDTWLFCNRLQNCLGYSKNRYTIA